jgi:hypothetical protein
VNDPNAACHVTGAFWSLSGPVSSERWNDGSGVVMFVAYEWGHVECPFGAGSNAMISLETLICDLEITADPFA